MSVQPSFTTPADRARPLNVVGEHITVLASGEATGSYEVFLQEGPEGAAPSPTRIHGTSRFLSSAVKSTSAWTAVPCAPHSTATWCMSPPARRTGFAGVVAAVRWCR